MRHGISRLPRGEERASKRGRSAETRLGYVHTDACELRLAQGKLFMSLATDRVPTSTHVAFMDADTKADGAAFLREVVAAFPHRLHAVPTDSGVAFADLPRNRGSRPEIEAIFGGRVFDRVRDEHGIGHRPAKPYHPWTNGQAERMDRTDKQATVKTFRCPDLEALRWRTPLQATRDAWRADPSALKIDPRHLIPGPHT